MKGLGVRGWGQEEEQKKAMERFEPPPFQLGS